jgi:hypothetical protein
MSTKGLDRRRLPVLVDGHKYDFGLRDPDCLLALRARGFDIDFDCDRGPADTDGLRVETHNIADENRLMKDHPVHSHGDEVVGAACFSGLDGSGQVDVTQDNSSENGAVLVGVAREKRYSQCGIANTGRSSGQRVRVISVAYPSRT